MNNLTGTAAARVRLAGTSTGVFDDGEKPYDLTKTISLTFGAGANQANNVYEASRLLASSASESLDFNGGGLLNAFGEAIAFTELKGLYIENTHATQVLTIGGATNLPAFGAAGQTLTIRPGGFILWVAPDAAGYAMVAGTSDRITLTNAAGTDLTYKILAWGN